MANLSALLAPQSIAVVGASPDPHTLRGRTIKVLREHAYLGRIYPISKSHAEVQGLSAYRTIADVPERVDLAVLIIPAEFVPDELERCGRAGVKAALILSSGFAEARGDTGAELQSRVRELSARYQMAVCGPNTEGFVNTAAALCPTFSPAVEDLPVSLVPSWRTSGHVAVIAQSGGMGFAFFDRGRPKEIPFSYVITTGNEACLEGFDLVEHVLEDGRTDVFLMFLESIKSASTFRRVARKALTAGKPIIVAKIGQSEAGRRAAFSHTAALTGPYHAYGAMLSRYGIVLGSELEDMVDLAQAFSFYRDRLPRGMRVGIGTAAGGGGGWLADACIAAGLQVPELDPETRARIDAHIPAYGTSQNPVDSTAGVIRVLGYAKLASLIAESDRVDAVILVISGRSLATLERDRENLFRVARETTKPILMWSYTNPLPEAVRLLSQAGYPLFTNMRHCARTLAAMARYAAARAAFEEPRHAQGSQRESRARVRLARTGTIACESEAAEVLEHYGVPFPPAKLVSNVRDAVQAAKELARPVALKVQSAALPHKSAVGALALSLREPREIECAYEAVLANAHRERPGAEILGVLVQAMVPRGFEMIVGVRRDSVFGPMLMLGSGGTAVEVTNDVAFAPVPLTPRQARELLASLRARELLDGARGSRSYDVDALIALVVRVSEFALDFADEIEELDLNPVIVHARGEGVSVVDALIVKR
jgi:acyl-CoA synthetase (NDP forming)